MHVLASHQTVINSAPGQKLLCINCKAPYWLPEGQSDPELCPACRRAEAAQYAASLVQGVNDLVRGTADFSILTQAERQGLLNSLGVSAVAKPDTDCCPDAPVIAGRITREAAERVIVPSDEPIYTWDGEEPDPETRRELELRLEALAEEEAMEAINVYETDLG